MRTERIWQAVVTWTSLVLLVFAVIAPLALLVWLVFFTHTFLVHAITVVDARPQTTEQVKKIIDDSLNQENPKLIRRNIFFVPATVLEHRILADVPQVRSIHITRALPDTITAIVQEKTPALLLLSNAKYYFVDSDGIAYEEAQLDTLPGIVLPTVKNTEQGADLTLGSPVVTSDFVRFVQTVQTQLPKQINAHVADILIPSLAAREVTFRLDNNWEIRFDTTRPPADQLDLLHKLLDTMISDQDKAKLEYVDLRIPSRIYYKLRGDTQ